MTHSYRTAFKFLAALTLTISAGTYAQETPYREDGWARFPDGRKWGATSAIDIDRDGAAVRRFLVAEAGIPT